MSPVFASATTATMALSFLTLLLSITFVFAENPAEFFNDLPLSTNKNVQISGEHIKHPRFLALLELKQSMAKLLPKMQDSDNENSESGDSSVEAEADKRVFCNGFTGCGGRFRGRRKQHSLEAGKRLERPLFTKRPFCNTYGCYNGKKRSSEVATELRDDEPEISQEKLADFANGWANSKLRRLLCNDYASCKIFGKHGGALGLEESKEISDGQQGLLPVPAYVGAEKRYFSDDHDKEWEDLIESMKR